MEPTKINIVACKINLFYLFFFFFKSNGGVINCRHWFDFFFSLTENLRKIHSTKLIFGNINQRKLEFSSNAQLVRQSEVHFLVN